MESAEIFILKQIIEEMEKSELYSHVVEKETIKETVNYWSVQLRHILNIMILHETMKELEAKHI